MRAAMAMVTAAGVSAALALSGCGGSNPEGVTPSSRVKYEKPGWMNASQLKEAVRACRYEMREVDGSRKQAALTYYYCLKDKGLANVHFVR